MNVFLLLKINHKYRNKSKKKKIEPEACGTHKRQEKPTIIFQVLIIHIPHYLGKQVFLPMNKFTSHWSPATEEKPLGQVTPLTSNLHVSRTWWRVLRLGHGHCFYLLPHWQSHEEMQWQTYSFFPDDIHL